MARITGVPGTGFAALVLVAALAACTGSDAAAENGRDVVATSAVEAAAGQAAPTQGKGRRMASRQCGSSEIERSTCMIEMILADLKSSGIGVGGGGITSIKAGAGLSYTVALPKEERTVLLTYDFVASDGGLTIGSRKEATESY